MGDKRRWLVEVDRHCHMITPKRDVTDHTTWPAKQDWSTTKNGAVVWVTKGSKPFTVQQRCGNVWDTTGYIYPELTPGANNLAKVTVYYPHIPTCAKTGQSTVVTSVICACGGTATTCLPNQVCDASAGTCTLQSCSGTSNYPCRCGSASICLDNQVCDAGSCACTSKLHCNGHA